VGNQPYYMHNKLFFLNFDYKVIKLLHYYIREITIMRSTIIVIFLLISSPSGAASFNCAQATSVVEKHICGNAELSKLDDELNAEYKRALSEMLDKAPLRIDQKQWLKSQRNKCRNIDCLKKAYRSRIDELKSWNADASNDKDIFGNYWIERYNYNPSATGAWKPEKTIDCLTLIPGKNGEVHFTFFINGDNMHSCGMKGIATFTGSYYELKHSDTSDENISKECLLRIKIKRNSILISDPDNACRQDFCGTRAGIDGTEFSRKQKYKGKCGYYE